MKKYNYISKSKLCRRQKGSMCVEVSVTAILFVIFTILGFDMLTVAFGYSILDSAARDAARAAAATGNKADGLIAAQQTVRSHQTDGYFVVQPTVSDLIPADFIYYTPAKGSPFVTVTTRSQLRIQTPVSFFGAYLANGLFPVARSYTFPILGVPFVPSPVVAAAATGATTVPTGSGTGSSGSGTGKTGSGTGKTGSSTGSSGSGAGKTGSGTGSTGSGTGSTGSGTGSTGSGTGSTGSGTGSTGSGTGSTGSGTGSTGSGTGSTGSGTGSTGSGTGSTGSGTGSSGSGTGSTGSGTGSTGSGTGSTGSGTGSTAPPLTLPSAGFSG